jgi:hypothetical protein
MKIEYSNGIASFNLVDMIECLSKERLDEIVDVLACSDKIVEEVANQIIGGYTSLGSHGGRGGFYPEPWTPLDKAAREIAKASGDIARKQIEGLERALASEKESCHEWVRKYHELSDRVRS